MDIKDLEFSNGTMEWADWLASVYPIATALIDDMNAQAIPVLQLRKMYKGDNAAGLPPDLPGVYGFFTKNPEDKFPLIKFGESSELFARLVSHLGVKPLKPICPIRYKKEKNSFSGDSTFRVKIAVAMGLISETGWKKTDLRGEATDLAKQINNTIDNYRVAWKPLLFGRKDIQTWAEWNNTSEFRATQMAPHHYQARLKPAFDKSLFKKPSSFWREKLGLL